MADDRDSTRAEQFVAQAEQRECSLIAELLAFMAQNKKWWLTPILTVLLLVGVLLVLATTAAAPLIYPLF